MSVFGLTIQQMGSLIDMRKNKKETILNAEIRRSFLKCTEKDSGDQNQISGNSGECGIMERRNECVLRRRFS